MKTGFSWMLCATLVSAMLGCSQDTSSSAASNGASTNTTPSPEGLKYLLKDEPSGAKDVIQVRKDAKHGEEVVMRGRIGGRAKPWIDGMAAFSIVDPSLKACSDIPGDACPIPWDYCCETDKLPTAMASVQVVDGDGGVIRTDARELLALKELSTIIVTGKAKRDDEGNLTILASGIFVQKP